MDHYWLVGQIGILLEVVGAGYIVVSAYESKKRMTPHVATANTINGIGEAVDELVKIVEAQFKDERRGFVMLVIGLIMQFIGGFA